MLPLLFLACASQRHTAHSEDSLAVMSLNIRMNYQDDGPNNWENRVGWIEETVERYAPGILGIEEAYYPQYTDLKNRLEDYNAFGPVEGWQGAESVALFYRKDRYRVVDSGTFWLSETPNVQSLGWDAQLRRTAKWAHLRTRDGQEVFAFVTHFDHKGDSARMESVRLLEAKVGEIAGNRLAVVMGDFNLRPTSDFYKRFTLFDTGIHARHYVGPDWTVNAFGAVPPGKRVKIDYIFTNRPVEVLQYTNLAEQRWEVYLSDHNPQLVVFR